MAMRQYFFVLEPKLLETARKCLVVFYGKILEKINPSLRTYYVSFFRIERLRVCAED